MWVYQRTFDDTPLGRDMSVCGLHSYLYLYLCSYEYHNWKTPSLLSHTFAWNPYVLNKSPSFRYAPSTVAHPHRIPWVITNAMSVSAWR